MGTSCTDVRSPAWPEYPVPAAAFFAWFGRDPSSAEAVLFDACLVASLDHGPNPPSAQAACLVAAAGKPWRTRSRPAYWRSARSTEHAGSAAGTWLVAHREAGAAAAVRAALETGSRIPGFGHPVTRAIRAAAALFGVPAPGVVGAPRGISADAVARELSRQGAGDARERGRGLWAPSARDMGGLPRRPTWSSARPRGWTGRHAREAAAQAGGGYLREPTHPPGLAYNAHVNYLVTGGADSSVPMSPGGSSMRGMRCWSWTTCLPVWRSSRGAARDGRHLRCRRHPSVLSRRGRRLPSRGFAPCVAFGRGPDPNAPCQCRRVPERPRGRPRRQGPTRGVFVILCGLRRRRAHAAAGGGVG